MSMGQRLVKDMTNRINRGTERKGCQSRSVTSQRCEIKSGCLQTTPFLEASKSRHPVAWPSDPLLQTP